MSTRSIAREIAVIVLPQLPKDKSKISKLEIGLLVARAVRMLSDHAKQNLDDASALLVKALNELDEVELSHPVNKNNIERLAPAPLTTAELKKQVQYIERAINFTAEALDIPDYIIQSPDYLFKGPCRSCGTVNEFSVPRTNASEAGEFLLTLISAYLDHKEEIDSFIKQAKAKWRVERMVSIDRDILRLACAEAFYITDVPINVAISEAVELCHRFADEKAAKFINGVLADLSEEAKYFRRKGFIRKEGSKDVDSDSSLDDEDDDEGEILQMKEVDGGPNGDHWN
jgi:N utilization substance protein B